MGDLVIVGIGEIVDSSHAQYWWENFRSRLGPFQEQMIAERIVDHGRRKLTPHVGVHVIDVRLGGPGTDHDILDVVEADSSYPALGRTEDGSWIQIDVDMTVGWVSAEYVEVSPSVDDLMVVDMMADAMADDDGEMMAEEESEDSDG